MTLLRSYARPTHGEHRHVCRVPGRRRGRDFGVSSATVGAPAHLASVFPATGERRLVRRYASYSTLMATRQEPASDESRVHDEMASTVDVANAAMHVDRCIDAYAQRCRQRIPAFVDEHISLEQAWSTQKQTFWPDVLIGPVNSVWAIPYWTIRKACTGLDALGVPVAGSVLRSLKPGLTSGYQIATEATLARELLEWDLEGPSASLPSGLVKELEHNPAIRRLRLNDRPASLRPIRTVIDEFSSGRALVADLAGAALTLGVSWLAFRSTSMGLFDIANRFARQDAKSRAASHFVFGRRAGNVFFSVFRPQASNVEIGFILVTLTVAVAAGAMLCVLGSEHLLKVLGLHQRRLSALVDKIEREMVVLLNRDVKSALRTADARNPGSASSGNDEHMRG